ncbi:MAG: DNA topoisomerase I [Methanomicrobiales archaeon]|nr:DNA topoisomerase I [Methanomicrobiales archaeon]
MHLIIAEKKLSAQRIAQILGGERGLKVSRENGLPIFSFDDTFITGLKGHVVEIDFSPEYADWRSERYTPRTLIDAPTLKRVTERKIVQLIQRLGRKASLVTIATDYDTEGELIGKEALELISEVNPSVQVRRARFSSITPQEIREAFSHASDLDMALASAGEARQMIDLVWGASLTRFISIAARRGGSSILSVGRVQSPTLAMIVDREREIEAFVPEKYWVLYCTSEKEGVIFRADHAHGRFEDLKEAEAARDATTPPLRVLSLKEFERQEQPPAPLDTTGLIVAAAKLGFSAARAMQVSEDLYMNGYISYPRTDNTVYPKTLNLGALLKTLESTPFAEEVRWVEAHARPSPARGKKESTDHPPIHPTGAGSREVLGEERFRLYELVVRRFLATLSPDARWHTIRAQLKAGEEPYAAAGSRLIEQGWRRVYRYSEVREMILPPLVVGEELPLKDVVMEEKETQPPPRFTQSRLIQRMEELGLGTKSTRHEVIQKLIARRYIFGNPLRPTLVARAVIEALEDHVDTITKPEMTRVLEEYMQQIKERKRTREDVVLESRAMLNRIFDELEAHEGEIGKEIVEKTAEEQSVGVCPLCGGRLSIKLTREKNQFIGCSGYPQCSFNTNLPPAVWGRAVRTETVCGKHGLHHVRLVKKGKRPWDLGCPLCMQIETQRNSLKLMPSMNDSVIARLQESHIYSVNEIAPSAPERIAEVLGVSRSEAERLIAEAGDALARLRRRSELRKFLRAHLPFRKGRSWSAMMERLIAEGIEDIGRLAGAGLDSLKRAGLSADEATQVIEEGRRVCDERLLREIGIPAPSLKKYFAAGYSSAEGISRDDPLCVSLKTGISLATVIRHMEKVYHHLGRTPPKRASAAEAEREKARLQKLLNLSDPDLARLICAGIRDMEGLMNADPAVVSGITGIPVERLRELISSANPS